MILFKNHKIKFLVVSLMTLLILHTYAIPHALKEEKGCEISAIEENCVSIDIHESASSLLNSYILKWDMGDGTTQQGTIISHCYDSLGSYQAVLSLIHKRSGKIIENELTVDVNLIRTHLNLLMPEKAEVFTPISFSSEMELSAQYQVLSRIWSFGDGVTSEAQTPSHSYQQVGVYTVDLTIQAASVADTVSFCQSQTIEVAGYNVDGALIAESLNQLHDGPSHQRFLKDSIHLVLHDKTDTTQTQIVKLNKEKYAVAVAPEREYALWLWSGPSFSKTYSFDTKGLSVSQANKKFKEQLTLSLTNSWQTFQPVYFEKDQVNSSEENIKVLQHNLQLLLDNPHVTILIGTYTYSGKGSIDLNTRISLKRSKHVRDYYTNRGINQKRMQAISPVEDISLLNTGSSPGLPFENDESLNTRSDIKINRIRYVNGN